MLLKLETGVALGFFAMGCAPGGGASNIYTYLLNGDLSLSITMTLVSTFASLGKDNLHVQANFAKTEIWASDNSKRTFFRFDFATK